MRLAARAMVWLLAICHFISAFTTQGLIEALATTEELSNLTSFLGSFPDLVAQISQLSNITFLAPTNDAFASFLNSSASTMLLGNDTSLIQDFFVDHVLNGSYDFESWTDRNLIRTALQANFSANQVVQVTRLKHTTSFSSSPLSKAARDVSGRDEFDVGSIYVVDQVLPQPSNFSSAAVASSLAAFVGAVEAVEMTGILDTLLGTTIFAPSNDALATVGNVLSGMTGDELPNIFEYHAVNGTVTYSHLFKDGDQLPTILSKDFRQRTGLTIFVVGDEIYANSARVVASDLLLANGVMHIIDNVLNSDNQTVGPVNNSSEAAFPGAETPGDATAIGSAEPSSTGNGNSTSSDGPSTGTLAGGKAGGVLGGLLIVGGAIFVWRRRRRSRRRQGTPLASDLNDVHQPGTHDKAELSGDGVNRRHVLPKHELWTNANHHEADGRGIARGTGEAAELPGEDVEQIRTAKESGPGVSSTSEVQASSKKSRSTVI